MDTMAHQRRQLNATQPQLGNSATQQLVSTKSQFYCCWSFGALCPWPCRFPLMLKVSNLNSVLISVAVKSSCCLGFMPAHCPLSDCPVCCSPGPALYTHPEPNVSTSFLVFIVAGMHGYACVIWPCAFCASSSRLKPNKAKRRAEQGESGLAVILKRARSATNPVDPIVAPPVSDAVEECKYDCLPCLSWVL